MIKYVLYKNSLVDLWKHENFEEALGLRNWYARVLDYLL